MHHDAEVFTDSPKRIVLAVMVRRVLAPYRGEHHSVQAIVVAPSRRFHCLVDIEQKGNGGDPKMALWVVGHQFGEPAVVCHGAGPLQFRHRVLGRKAQSGAKGRGVLFGDAIGEDNLRGDAVFCQHLAALGVVPGSGELFLDRRAPGVIDLLDQELFLGLVHHVHLDVNGHVDEVVVFGFDIGLVLGYGQPRVTVGGNNQ